MRPFLDGQGGIRLQRFKVGKIFFPAVYLVGAEAVHKVCEDLDVKQVQARAGQPRLLIGEARLQVRGDVALGEARGAVVAAFDDAVADREGAGAGFFGFRVASSCRRN